jgi:hypothetical protein
MVWCEGWSLSKPSVVSCTACKGPGVGAVLCLPFLASRLMTDFRSDESKNDSIFREDAVIFQKRVEERGRLVITGGCMEVPQVCFIFHACSLPESMVFADMFDNRPMHSPFLGESQLKLSTPLKGIFSFHLSRIDLQARQPAQTKHGATDGKDATLSPPLHLKSTLNFQAIKCTKYM